MLQMVKKNNLYALDFGTTKFCIASLVYDRVAKSYALHTISVPAQGMKRGMLSDINLARKAIVNLIEKCESQLSVDIKKVAIGIAGSHLDSYHVTKQYPLNGIEITKSFLNKIDSDIKSHPRKNRENLHTIPIAYKLDERNWIDNPLGMSANCVTSKYLIIDADRNYLKDILMVCNHSGIEVSSLYSEPLASASVTINDDQKEIGTAIADIGGGTTDGIIFQFGKPTKLFTINIGGLMMTRDLAIGLNLPHKEAEKIKMFFGLNSSETAEIEVEDLQGNIKKINQSQVSRILHPRIYELCSLIKEQIFQFSHNMASGILLTGGGSEVKNINSVFNSNLKMNVATVQPSFDINGENSVYANKFATVLGLLNLEFKKMQRKSHTHIWNNQYFSQFVNWLKELS